MMIDDETINQGSVLKSEYVSTGLDSIPGYVEKGGKFYLYLSGK